MRASFVLLFVILRPPQLVFEIAARDGGPGLTQPVAKQQRNHKRRCENQRDASQNLDDCRNIEQKPMVIFATDCEYLYFASVSIFAGLKSAGTPMIPRLLLYSS